MKRNVVLENRWVKLFEDTYQLENGTPCSYYHVERSDAVMAIALDYVEGEVYTYIVRQHRHPIGEKIWQFPLGGVDLKKENIEECAIKELKEETGVVAGRMDCVGSFYTDPGFTNQKMHVCITSNIIEIGEQKLEQAEHGLVSRRVPLGDDGLFLEKQQMADSWSICGYHYIKRYLGAKEAKCT